MMFVLVLLHHLQHRLKLMRYVKSAKVKTHTLLVFVLFGQERKTLHINSIIIGYYFSIRIGTTAQVRLTSVNDNLFTRITVAWASALSLPFHEAATVCAFTKKCSLLP